MSESVSKNKKRGVQEEIPRCFTYLPKTAREYFEREYFDGECLKTIPGTLYHYCSLDSMGKIIQSNSLHLSNAKYLNDRREFRQILDEILPALERYSSETLTPEALFDYAPFVFCLSEEPDDLYQWRAYGDGGKGVAIGFDSSDFPFVGRTIPVLYDKNKIDFFVNELDEKLSLLFGNPEFEYQDDERLKDIIPFELIETAILFGAGFKHESFSNEKEHRLVVSPTLPLDQIARQSKESLYKPIKYKYYSGWVKPFLELNFSRVLPIKNITLGPSLTPSKEEIEDMKRSIHWLLQEHSHDLSKDDISVSNSPFRG
jgi:hypothetical protein